MALRPETLDYYVGRTRDILIDVAKGKRERKIIFYKELMDEMGGPGRGYIAEVLEEICCREHEKGHPLLSALVIHSGNRLPGYGFWCMRFLPERARNYSDEEKRIFWVQECEKIWRFWQAQ